ncbi:MAG TPA: GntR family transcriptional regulator [Oscillospiraceae bacterium]|nr:GntR family transcriptional regulator [Oscillospiraceae bacterium]
MDISPIYSSEYIYHILSNEILNLNIKPGQSISENELCERFSVSRTPVRTALQRLHAAGLVNIIPYKGSVVTLLNMDDINQMIYMRVAIESMVIRDFMDLCTPILQEKLRYIIRKQTVIIDDECEISKFYEMDSQLHEVWFKVTKKERLWKLIQKSQVNYTRFRMLDIVAVQNFKQIIEEHTQLFDIICEKDAAAVEPLIHKHLYGGINRLGNRIHTEFKDYFQPMEQSIFLIG